MKDESSVVAKEGRVSYAVVGIIPAYKPDEKLISLVHSCLRQFRLLRIVIVDDGSGDEFRGLFDSLSAIEGVDVLHLAVNSGTGGAIKCGLQHSLYAFPEAMGFVTFDADGQHLAEDVGKVVDSFVRRPNDLALGVRNFHDPTLDIPLRSKFGNLVTEWFFRLLTGIRLVDTQTGLRCYPRAMAATVTQILRNRYEFQLEALMVAAERLSYQQIPIRTVYEDRNSRSHFNPIKDSILIYMVFFRFVLATVFCSVLDYIVFCAAFIASGALFASMLSARIVSVTVNFMLNRNKVFRDRGSIAIQCLKFIMLACALFGCSYYGVRWLASSFGVNPLVSKIAVEVLLFFGSFLVQRSLIFNHRPEIR